MAHLGSRSPQPDPAHRSRFRLPATRTRLPDSGPRTAGHGHPSPPRITGVYRDDLHVSFGLRRKPR